ncbi:MAG: imidazolonepropionase [Phycisphaerales bacterium]
MAGQRVIFENVRIVTPLPSAKGLPLRGADARTLRVVPRGHVVCQDGRVTSVGESPAAADTAGALRVDGAGRVLLPALVDCHTHACWAGERWGEWEAKRAGVPYLEILKHGGGIMSTVRAVRAASEDNLAGMLAGRLVEMRACGTGAVEVKTGYGLDTATELKMLRAIQRVAGRWPAPVVPTLLAGHALDKDNPAQLQDMLDLVPQAAQLAPGIAVDAFCEEGAWTLDMTRALLERAHAAGLPVRLHVDQFNALGGLELALQLGARSVDHLEATTSDGLRALAASSTIGVALPVCGFALDGRYANARALLDHGGALALASNWNPGSAPSPSVAFAAALACRFMGLTPAEALVAITWNAACVLGLQDQCGAIAPGYRSDLILLPHTDERALCYEVASSGPDASLLGTDLRVK